MSKFFVGKNAEEKASDTRAAANSTPDAFTALKQGNRNRLLVICGTYSIGKERICKAIALALNTKIFASPPRSKSASSSAIPSSRPL